MAPIPARNLTIQINQGGGYVFRTKNGNLKKITQVKKAKHQSLPETCSQFENLPERVADTLHPIQHQSTKKQNERTERLYLLVFAQKRIKKF
jgi:hypothetical protein